MPDLLGGLNLGAVGNIVAVVGVAGLDKFERDLQRMATAVDGKAQFINKSLTVAAAAGAMVFASSIAAAAEFESSFTGVTKTIDGLSDDFGNLNFEGERLAGQFRDLALEIPASVNELAKIGELGGQLGVGKDDILEFTRVIADLGNTTNLSMDEGATSIARFINVTGQVAPVGMQMSEQASRIGSAVVDLGNKMATTEQEITAFGLRIAGAGAQIGLSQSEILAFGAALSSVGIKAEMGGTAISKLFIDISNTVAQGGEKLQLFADIAGMTVPEFSRLFEEDAAGAITAFFTGLNESQKSGESLFPILEELGYKEDRLRDTILRSASAADLFNNAVGYSTTAFKENTAMAIEAQKRYGTFESKLKLFNNQLNEVSITMGNRYLPALSAVLGAMNSSNIAIKATMDTVGTMITVFGGAALAFKAYQTASKLVVAANVAMNGSLGPVALGLTAIVVALSVAKAAHDSHMRAMLSSIETMSEGTVKIKGLEIQYKALSDKEKLTEDDQKRLAEITEKLTKLYEENGISIMEMAGNYGDLAEKARELQLNDLNDRLKIMREELEKIKIVDLKTIGANIVSPLLAAKVAFDKWAKRDELTQGINAATQELEELIDVEKRLANMGIQTGDAMRKLLLEFEATRSEIKDKTSPEYKELTSRIDALKAKLGEVTSDPEVFDWMKELSDAGITLSSAIQADIDKLERLLPYVAESGDKAALKQLREQLKGLYAAVGEYAPWDPASQGMAGFMEVTENTARAVGDVKNRMGEVADVITDYKTKEDLLVESGIKLDSARQKEIKQLEYLKTHYPLTAYEVEQIEQKLSSLRGETDEGGKSWVEYAGYINDITSRFGPAGETIGKAVNLIATSVTHFDPLTFGINALGFAFDLFGSKSEPVVRSIEEVEASLGTLQTRIEETNAVIQGMGIESTWIENLQGFIDEYKEMLRTATGSWAAGLESSIEYFEQILEDLTYAFRTEDTFAAFTDNLDILIEKAQYYSDYFGNIDMSGFSRLLMQEIENSYDLLQTLDPMSQAYADMIEKIQDAYNWYSQLSGPVNLLTELYPEMTDELARLYEAQFINAEFLGDESVMLERLATSRLLYSTSIEEQIAVYEQLLPLLEEGSEEYEAVTTLLELLRQETDLNTESTLGFVDAMALVGTTMREAFGQYEGELKAASDAIDELLFFQIDLDTSDADEQIEAMLSGWMEYLQTLNPNSPAYQQGLAALRELWQKYRDAREQLTGLNDESAVFSDDFQDAVGEAFEAAQEPVEEFTASIQESTIELERFQFAMDETLSLLRGDFDAFEKGVRFVEKALEEIAYFNLDLDTTDLDEKIAQSLIEMQEYIKTLDPNSQAFRDAMEYFDKLKEKFEALGDVDLPQMNISEMNISDIIDTEKIIVDFKNSIGKETSQVKIPFELDPFADQGDISLSTDVNLSDLSIDVGDMLRNKYDKLVEQLGEARSYLDDLLAGESNKMAEIDTRYLSQLTEKQDIQESLEAQIQGLYERRREISFQYDKQIEELDDTAHKLSGAINDILQNGQVTTLRDIELAVKSLTGVTRTFSLDWSNMLDTVLGGTGSEFYEYQKNLTAAEKALEEALYFGKDIGGTDLDSQLNAMIYSMQQFLDTLDPNSQAMKDGWEAFDGLVKKFREAGGTLDANAGQKAAEEWAQSVQKEIEGQISDLQKESEEQLIPIDADISLAEAQLLLIDTEINTLMEKWKEERIDVKLEIEQAEQAVNRLDSALEDFFEKYKGQMIDIGLNITPDGGTTLSLEGGYNEPSNGQNNLNVIIHNGTPDTWAEIVDNDIEPRLNERTRKYFIGGNPYA